jgi:hypothetical protein
VRGPFYQADATAHVVAPPRGRAVLACRCGRMLDLVDMHRPPQRDVPGERAGTAIDPILCARCAEAGMPPGAPA